MDWIPQFCCFKYLILCIFLLTAAELLKDRSDVQCLHRWQKVLNPNLVKGPWTKEVSVHSHSHESNV
jgi:hypothetical protein